MYVLYILAFVCSALLQTALERDGVAEAETLGPEDFS